MSGYGTSGGGGLLVLLLSPFNIRSIVSLILRNMMSNMGNVT